jgi:hypothetical protein
VLARSTPPRSGALPALRPHLRDGVTVAPRRDAPEGVGTSRLDPQLPDNRPGSPSSACASIGWPAGLARAPSHRRLDHAATVCGCGPPSRPRSSCPAMGCGGGGKRSSGARPGKPHTTPHWTSAWLDRSRPCRNEIFCRWVIDRGAPFCDRAEGGCAIEETEPSMANVAHSRSLVENSADDERVRPMDSRIRFQTSPEQSKANVER